MKALSRTGAPALIILLILLGLAALAPAADPPDSLELAQRLVELKPLDAKRIASTMELDCLQGVAGSALGKRLDFQETKDYCRVVGQVFWAQIEQEVREAMAKAYAHYLTQRELEVLIEGLQAERQHRASRFPPQETKTVVAQLRRVDPGIKSEVSWQVKEIVRRWKERFSLDNYFKDQFRELVLQKLPLKIRTKVAY